MQENMSYSGSADGPHVDAMAQIVQNAMRFLQVLWRRKHLLVASCAAAGLLGGLYYTTSKRTFEAEASILIVGSQGDSLDTSLTGGRNDPTAMATYEKLIASPLVLESAAKLLDGPTRVALGSQDPEIVAVILKNHLKIKGVRSTNLIDLKYRAQDPRAAAMAVGAIIKAYSLFMQETHRGSAGTLVEVLTKEKTDVDLRLQKTEAEFLVIRQRVGDLGIKSDGKVMHPLVERAIQLNAALIEAQKKRLSLQASQASFQTAIQNKQNIRQSLMAIEESLGKEAFLDSVGLSSRDKDTRTSLEKQLFEERTQLETMLEFYGPQHPKVIERTNKIRKIEQYLDQFDGVAAPREFAGDDEKFAQMISQILDQKVSAAVQHETWLTQSFEQAKQDSIGLASEMARLDIADHDLRWLRELRNTILNQIASVDLRQEHGGVKMSVVREPLVPSKPVSPNLLLTLVAVLVGGGSVGIGMIVVVDVLDDRIRSPEDLQTFAGLSLLTMMGSLEDEADRDEEGSGLESTHMHKSNDDAASEGFRTLRTVLAMNGSQSQRIAISSSEPGDGKTTASTNLAVAYSQAGKRVLLIDADMRKPGLTKLVGFRSMPGLSDILRGTQPVSDHASACIRRSGSVPIDIIPAGQRPSNPAELLLSERFSELLSWAETTYDQIIVDASPVLAGTDAAAIGRVCDGLVMVIRPEKNRRRIIVRSVQTLRAFGVNIFGAVINGVGIEADGYGYGYGYGTPYGDEVEEESIDDAFVTDDALADHEDSNVDDGSDPGVEDRVLPMNPRSGTSSRSRGASNPRAVA